MALTVKRVARLTKPGRYRDGLVRGLYLQVMSASNRSWLLRYALGGHERWLGLGSVETFSLAEARERAHAARQLLEDKIDPLTVCRAERAERSAAAAKHKTFKIVAEQYDAAHGAGWSKKHRANFLASLQRYAYPLIGDLPVSAIDEALVLQVLQPIWHTRTVTAKRVRRRIAAVMDFAAASGYRAGENPARWRGHLQHLLPSPEKIVTVQHFAALPYAELPALMSALRAVPGSAARALEFLILTAARTGEVLGATWDEIDLDNKGWVLSAGRMKTGREHRVPLSQQAMSLLRALPRDTGNYLFIGLKAGAAISEDGMRKVLVQLRPDLTVHGFRSSFRTWAEEQTSFAAVICEQALAHNVGNATERAYRCTDLFAKRARLMQQWADFCNSPIDVRHATPLRGRS
jgi:integrase